MVRQRLQSWARSLVVMLVILSSTAIFASPAAADWRSWLGLGSDSAGLRSAGMGVSALDTIARYIKAHPGAPDGVVLAAHASAEGHWSFANGSGERFTAGTPDELKRVVGVLAPGAANPDPNRLTFILTEDTIFNQRSVLKDLPRQARLMVGFADEAHMLLRRTLNGQERMFAEVRPNLLVEVDKRRLFDEAVWQLARPLDRANIRVLALEPGGPQAIPASPKFDPQTKRALTDAIDPVQLPSALRAIPRQMAVLSGRIDGDLLWYRPTLGSDRSLVLKDVIAAAEAADVNLVVLQSSAPRQPGARNWLWQKVSLGALDTALERPHLADFLNALGLGPNKLMVTASDVASASGSTASSGRIALKATPVKADGTTLAGLSEIFTDIVSDAAGRVVTSGVDGNMVASDRQRELGRRLIPGVPSMAQTLYLGLLLLGLVGLPVARGWWNGLWPGETREGYEGAAGFIAARTVRSVLFALLFLPAVAPASAPLALARLFTKRSKAAIGPGLNA